MIRIGFVSMWVLAGCVARPLSAGSSDGDAVDLAKADLTSSSSIDLAGAADLTSSSVVGVECGTQECSGSCCVDSQGEHCFGSGSNGVDSCFGTRLSCDGPEDCASGQRCIAQISPSHQLAEVRCDRQLPMNGAIVCHTNADCGGGPCGPPTFQVPSPLELKVCGPAD